MFLVPLFPLQKQFRNIVFEGLPLIELLINCTYKCVGWVENSLIQTLYSCCSFLNQNQSCLIYVI